jgi:aromatic-L-amino-acid/L-tryptophan decarboxylase
MPKSQSLDPENWSDLRADAHAALNAAFDHMQHRASAKVWQAPGAALRQSLKELPPQQGCDTADLSRRIAQEFLRHDVGNTHPRFFGWVHGAGTPEGMIPEIYAAAMNANLGGRDHVANLVEHQVIGWCREMFGFPSGSGGLVVSGTSLATLIALKAARDKHSMHDARADGAGHGKPLVGYASAQAHGCVAQAFDILGLGKSALRSVACDAEFRMNPAALLFQIEADRAAGNQPFCLIGTAGSVNTGAIDPLDGLADIAAAQDLWFHIDGAFGALAVLDPGLKPRLRGVARADSLAFDFHKWLHVNYDAGFVLMRDAEDQRRSFAAHAEYLNTSERGLAAGEPWFCDFGPELSRGFRALKVWYQISRFGLTRLGAQIASNCRDAAALGRMVEANTRLHLLAPVSLNIVCFRFDPGGLEAEALDTLNQEIVFQLQEQGLAAPSTTRINGRLAIRVNITNHRTQVSDLEYLVEKVLEIGGRF